MQWKESSPFPIFPDLVALGAKSSEFCILRHFEEFLGELL